MVYKLVVETSDSFTDVQFTTFTARNEMNDICGNEKKTLPDNVIRFRVKITVLVLWNRNRQPMVTRAMTRGCLVGLFLCADIVI